MHKIVSSVARVRELMGDIKAAVEEQAIGITEANHLIIDIDKVTHENAALVAKAAMASSKLEDQAAALSNDVAFFKVRDKYAWTDSPEDSQEYLKERAV